jgi:hypothetical protein
VWSRCGLNHHAGAANPLPDSNGRFLRGNEEALQRCGMAQPSRSSLPCGPLDAVLVWSQCGLEKGVALPTSASSGRTPLTEAR